ncbi:MAG: tripartite tricarboxylate transporter substrate binding protein [Burkholderiales bacterium]|nr:tripartite tricarboxylate transporter substrate binding protein [Burkholderiales bacterium]
MKRFAFLLSTLLAAASAHAQDWPSKPIRLIVPYGVGGGSDFVGRLVGQKLSEQLGQQVVVENRPGAASLVGTEAAARAAPDGYTLLLADSGFTINPAFYRNIKYDPTKDFAPVSVVAETPYLLVVNPSLPFAGSLKDFLAAAKAQPGRINVGSAGNGSGTHLTAELLKLRAGIDLTHVPYKSAGAAVGDVVGGQIQATMSSPPAALPLVKAGKLRALAAAAAKRSSLMPDVPTFLEGGVEGVQVTNWYSVMAVAGTPRPIIQRLHAEVARAVASPDMRERLNGGGLEPAPNTPEEFGRMVAGELTRWMQVIRDAKIRQE